MLRKILAALSIAAVLAGCSAATGPTFSAYSVSLPNNEKAFRVECYGLFEGQGTCYSKAREICGNTPVRPVQEIAPLAGSGGQRDVRVLTFQCGAASAPQPAPAPVAVAPAPQAPPPVPRKLSLSGDANFEVDKATLTAAARTRLDALIAAAQGMTFNTVAVSGFTDSTASAAHNQALSERRAQTVAQYLQEHGLKARQFVAKGYGKADPVASNATASGRAQNRRVEIALD
ncbi:OmpA family protein [Paraburkholderia sp. DD10]|uniref:OmpA family protein n=1 Tax=Paraburkholderia sp. DD10 TaxID=3409691 RepID=UPI0011AD2953